MKDIPDVIAMAPLALECPNAECEVEDPRVGGRIRHENAGPPYAAKSSAGTGRRLHPRHQ